MLAARSRSPCAGALVPPDALPCAVLQMLAVARPRRRPCRREQRTGSSDWSCVCTRSRALFSPGFTRRRAVLAGLHEEEGKHDIVRADRDSGAVLTAHSLSSGEEQREAGGRASLEAVPAAGASYSGRSQAAVTLAENRSPDVGGHEEAEGGATEEIDVVELEEEYVGHTLDRCLAHAVCKDNMTLVDELVSAGASVNRWLPRGDDALMPNALAVAAGCGNAAAVARLIELGANPKLANDDGYTALHFAVFLPDARTNIHTTNARMKTFSSVSDARVSVCKKKGVFWRCVRV